MEERGSRMGSGKKRVVAAGIYHDLPLMRRHEMMIGYNLEMNILPKLR